MVAADFIRNLKEETKKGFYGRLKQGILPMPAPLGYLNIGSGKPKEPDPKTAPLVRHLFQTYATGTSNFHSLLKEAEHIGLRGRSGKAITKNGLTKLLNNAFYTGLIQIKVSGQSFTGIHEPIIPTALFKRVQDVLHGRTNTRTNRHDFLFRRRLGLCLQGLRLYSDRQKPTKGSSITAAKSESAQRLRSVRKPRRNRFSNNSCPCGCPRMSSSTAGRKSITSKPTGFGTRKTQSTASNSGLARLTNG